MKLKLNLKDIHRPRSERFIHKFFTFRSKECKKINRCLKDALHPTLKEVNCIIPLIVPTRIIIKDEV